MSALERGRAGDPGSSAVASRAVTTLTREGEAALLRVSGRLDAASVAEIWPSVVAAVRARAGPKLAIDASGLSFCDGAGIGLLAELERTVRAGGGTVEFRGLSPGLRRILERALLPSSLLPSARPRRSAHLRVGRAVQDLGKNSRALLAFLGEVVLALAWAVRHPRAVRGRDLLLIFEKAGADAVPVVCLLGWLMGLIMSFQSVAPLQRYGAVQTIPRVLSGALTRELGPLITAIILAGRTGSDFAAELGTMKVTEEIDALRTFGLDPVRFLVLPRLLATMLVTPLLGVFATACGLVGGYQVMSSLGTGLRTYLEQLRSATTSGAVLFGFGKGYAFGFIVATIGCAYGIGTRAGPGAVGESTTRAVVASIVLIIAVDGVFALLWYSLASW